jgi:hypothetical protein
VHANRTPIEILEERRLLSVQPLGTEFRVNTYTTDGQAGPSIASDADGDFVVVWSSYRPGSSVDVFAQRYRAGGTPQGSEFRVNSFTTGGQLSPSVAMDPQGKFVIAWHGDSQDGSGSGIYAQRFDAAGLAQGAELRVNTYTTDSQMNPAVAMNPDSFVITWQSKQDGSLEGVYGQRYDAAGNVQGTEFAVNSYTLSEQRDSSVAMDSHGAFAVVWDSYGQDGSGWGVYAQRFNAAGQVQGSEFRVNTTTDQGQSSPTVAIDGTGAMVVGWQSDQDGSSYGIYAQRYSANGVAQGMEFRANTYTNDFQIFPTVAMDSDGDFVVAWTSTRQDPGFSRGVYAQAFDATGVPRGAEFRVNTYTPNGQGEQAIAMDADGDFLVAWHSSGQDGSGYGVYAQDFAVVPVVTTSDFLFHTAPHRVCFNFDENVSASLGTDDLIVQNLTTAQTIPASDFFLSYYPLTNVATFAYVGPGTNLIPTVLPDGNYRATLLAAGVTTPNGMPLPADHMLEFFFLNGDANRDRRVNLDDFNILAANFGQNNRNFAQGDFSYDTLVNLDDFNILAGRFGNTLSGVGTRSVEFSDDRVNNERWIEELLV